MQSYFHSDSIGPGRFRSMAEQAVSPFTRHLRGIGLRQVRLASGLVLFTYIATHFINHAFGNVSISAMEDVLTYQMLFWQSWPVLTVFYGAVLVHMGLGLWALYAAGNSAGPASR